MNAIRILVIDDHAIFRMGLASLLNATGNLQVIGDAADGATGIRLATERVPDLILLDLMMPEMDGVETTRRLLDAQPNARILLLTTFGTADGIGKALDAGALGAVLKSADLPELMQAIEDVSAGRTFISPEIQRILDAEPPLPTLTSRQIELLEGFRDGLSNNDIAQRLNISSEMVKEHARNLYQKLGVANRTEAIALAYRKHLIS